MPRKKATPAAVTVPASVVAAARVAPIIHILDQDVSESVWEHIIADPLALFEASKLCSAFRTHSCSSYGGTIRLKAFSPVFAPASLRRFVNAAALDCRDVQWLINDHLRTLHEVLPSMRRIDISGCQNVSSVGVKALFKSMPNRLLSFRQDTTPKFSACKHMKVTEGFFGIFVGKGGALGSGCPEGLEELSLTLGSAIKGSIQLMSNHPSLRKLALFFEGFTPLWLPFHLPELRELTIKTSTWSAFPWPSTWAHVSSSATWVGFATSYPKLELLTIDDNTFESGNNTLMRHFVEGWSRHFPQATIRVIKAGRRSDIVAPLVLRNGEEIASPRVWDAWGA